MKVSLAKATCVLEKHFPPAFFDINIHLLVHSCDEALLCGSVRYRWMYPFKGKSDFFETYILIIYLNHISIIMIFTKLTFRLIKTYKDYLENF